MLRGIRLDFSIPYESWRWRIQITFVPRFTGDCLNRICTFHRLTPFNVSLGLKLSLWLPFDPISVIALLSNLIGIAVVGCHVSQEVRGKLFGRNFLKGFPVLPLANDVDAQPWHNLPTTFVLAGAFLGFRCWTLSLGLCGFLFVRESHCSGNGNRTFDKDPSATKRNRNQSSINTSGNNQC